MDDEDMIRHVENADEFWQNLDQLVRTPVETHQHIDEVLRSFLALVMHFRQDYLCSEYDVVRCCSLLLDSAVFREHQDYVRRQMLYSLLQEDEWGTIHVAATFMLFDGRVHESSFEMMRAEGAFPRLVELVRDHPSDDAMIHRLLLELLFEMSRIQRLDRSDLVSIDDKFVLYLFRLIEELSDEAEDPYHYSIIRVLLVLNEQYMCLANAPASLPVCGPITNRIVKLLSTHGPSYRTFGENLILLLNRESALSAQLLILKLLYLLFTTPLTYEYFYTNDLHVLVDVIIRNLLDLDPGNQEPTNGDIGPEKNGQRALRHTYLRVLCPLLKNTQLSREGNNYKREEVRRMLFLLVNRSSAHFAPVDETVIRLALRCQQVEWLREEDDDDDEDHCDGQSTHMEQKLSGMPPRPAKAAPQQMLGMSLADAGVSGLSVAEFSAKVTREKPSVPAPRRNRRKKMMSLLDAPTNNGQQTHDGDTTTTTTGPDRRHGGRSPFADVNAVNGQG